MSYDSPTDRELLLEMLRRLRRIEERLGLTEYKSDIVGSEASGVSTNRNIEPVEPAVPPGPKPTPVNPPDPPRPLDPNAPTQSTTINPRKKA
jgi:hypothetical protein